jgi:enamine deaminase RidA (YjgF/YER057c/UK114 family)
MSSYSATALRSDDVLPAVLQPTGWARPKGYANGMVGHGTLVVTGGQIGWNSQCVFEAKDFVGQVRQTLQNIVDVIAEAGARPEHIVRLTWYVTDMDAYRAGGKAIGEAYRAVIGKHFPAMAVVQVTSLVETEALVEIEATAVIPD